MTEWMCCVNVVYRLVGLVDKKIIVLVAGKRPFGEGKTTIAPYNSYYALL